VQAQSVRWEPADSGAPNSVVLVYENCTPDGQPELPVIAGVTFTFLGRSESMNMINFQTSRSVSLSYLLRGRQTGPIQIPAFTVKTDKGPQRVAAFNASTPAAPLEAVASSRLLPEKTSVWSGEVFALNYELSASRRANPQISPNFDWNPAPLVAEDWSKPEVTEATVTGERRVNVLFRTRVAAKAPNTLKLDAASHLLSIQTGTIGFGIISQPRMEQVSVTSNQPTVEIRALPPAPAGFSGAVGQFKLTSKVVPEKAVVGEPVTWTLELSGTGNWLDIAGLPSREVSNDFQVVQPKAKRTPVEGKLFDVTLAEDVVLVPAKAGSYGLGPVSFTYFDPKAGDYKTISAPRANVTIAAAAPPRFNVTPQPAATESSPASASKPPVPPAVPPAPTAIPRDPLPGSAEAAVPMAGGPFVASLLAPVATLLGFWLWLAIRRAQQTDPVRPRREARDRLARTLAQLASVRPSSGAQLSTSNPQPPQHPLLQQWQRDAAVLWQIAHAAPSAAAFGDSAWSTLWSEADRALYGAGSALPSDWVARAQQALAAKRVPGFKARRLFLPQNLMPFAALFALCLLATPVWLHAAQIDPAASYRKGEFTAAEQGWRAAIGKNPTDWIARHNLSLSLAQQEQRAGEAAAQAAAAFVQKPDHPSVRWHFALAAERAGTAPAVLSRFITPGPLQSLGRAASAANWQWIMVGAAWLTAGAIGWLLWNAYGQRRRTVLRATLATALAGLTLLGTAAAGLHSYGVAADARAVIVARPGTLRSIPTEADTTQKTSPLAVGTLALGDKRFLGWTQLTFENGQTGWVRQEEIVPLWR
jgi:hypothetical protein